MAEWRIGMTECQFCAELDIWLLVETSRTSYFHVISIKYVIKYD